MFNKIKDRKIENLKANIVALERIITELRDSKIEAQISESRAQSGFNAQQETDRSKSEVMVAKIKAEHNIALNKAERGLDVLKADFAATVKLKVDSEKLALQKDYADKKINHKKELRAEFQAEIDSSKKAAKISETEAHNYKGLYNGALLVVKAFETQLAAANKLANTLVEALPEVKANIGSSAQTVTVNK